MQGENLEDRFGRKFSYLRLSVTDACNFRCSYCLPNGYQKPSNQKDDLSVLSVSEIQNLAIAMSELGMWKIRLTGGEPTLRRDLLEIVDVLAQISGIRKIALSTNGYRLKELAQPLLRAGVSSLNISVDSLDSKRFAEMTGYDHLDHILNGIYKALELGFESVKLNVVLMAGWNDQDLDSFIDWVKNRPVVVRFIELMPTAGNQDFFKKYHIQSHVIHRKLAQQGWSPVPRSASENLAGGPALEFSHQDYMGRMGIIAPYSTDFCATCNRLRVTSSGGLRLCLFGEGNHSIRHLLQSSDQKEELKVYMGTLLQKKEVSHYLPEGRFGSNRTFSAMGG